MFVINYRIVHNDYNDFPGQEGFFQLQFNDFAYGEIYSKEIEKDLFTEPLYDWFERLIKVATNLLEKEYVALSDVEAYDTWIEFRRAKEKLTVSVVKAEKWNGSRDIEFDLDGIKAGDWMNQMIDFQQFKEELITKVKAYLVDLWEYDPQSVFAAKLEAQLNMLQNG